MKANIQQPNELSDWNLVPSICNFYMYYVQLHWLIMVLIILVYFISHFHLSNFDMVDWKSLIIIYCTVVLGNDAESITPTCLMPLCLNMDINTTRILANEKEEL